MRLLSVEQRLLEASLRGFAPEGGSGLAPKAGEVDWHGSFGRMADASNGQAKLGMRAAIWIAGLSPVWLDGEARSLLSLSDEERVSILERLLAHRSFAVRELVLLLKLQAAFALLGTASARARSGFDRDRPPPVDAPAHRLPVVNGALEGGRS